ncbi:MAG: hypothetical protein GX616_02060, partial [Planctomycetes bacterium]|nr:hypothetical protein [Planctomycetota bacterium]
APVVSDIPDQTIAEGASFATIALDDYVSDVDNTDAEMTWTYSGNTALTVSIVNRVATIGIPNANWNGAETITFKATDPGGLFADDAATFTVTAVNDAPVVSDIPDQTIAEGASFATIALDDYVSDVDNTDAEMAWTSSGNTDLTVSIVNRVATISAPAEWTGAETITFRATDPGALWDEDAATFGISGCAAGAAVVEGNPTVVTANTVQTVSISHTTGSGVDRLMLVGVSWNSSNASRPISSVTFTPDNGTAVPLSQVISQDHGTTTPYRYAAIYSLLNPPSGQAGTVTITFADGTVTAGIVAGVANFAGVDQTTPLGTPAGAYSPSNDTTPTVTLSALGGDELVFDTVFLGGNPPATLTAGAGQTQLPDWNVTIGNARGAASTEQATGGSVTMSWTAGASSLWVIAAVPINPSATKMCKLTMVVSPVGGGTTVPAVGIHPYAENSVVNISATAATGYEFTGWAGDVADPNSASTTVTMSADKTVNANFAPLCYTLATSVAPAGSGSVSANPAPNCNGGTQYTHGTVVALTATANDGYSFAKWTGGASGTANPVSVTMMDNKSV